MKRFTAFVEEDLTCQRAHCEIGELNTSDAVADAFRFEQRLSQMRYNLRAILDADDALDDELLARTGLTRWDRTEEATDPAQTAAQREVQTAKRQELTAKQRVLQAKQADLAVKQRKVQRDIATTGGTR